MAGMDGPQAYGHRPVDDGGILLCEGTTGVPPIGILEINNDDNSTLTKVGRFDNGLEQIPEATHLPLD